MNKWELIALISTNESQLEDKMGKYPIDNSNGKIEIIYKIHAYI